MFRVCHQMSICGVYLSCELSWQDPPAPSPTCCPSSARDRRLVATTLHRPPPPSGRTTAPTPSSPRRRPSTPSRPGPSTQGSKQFDSLPNSMLQGDPSDQQQHLFGSYTTLPSCQANCARFAIATVESGRHHNFQMEVDKMWPLT